MESTLYLEVTRILVIILHHLDMRVPLFPYSFPSKLTPVPVHCASYLVVMPPVECPDISHFLNLAVGHTMQGRVYQ